MNEEDLTHDWPDGWILTSNLPLSAVVTDLLDRRQSAVLGQISVLLAQCSAVLVESSVRLAFWADFRGQVGPIWGHLRGRPTLENHAPA